MSDERNVEQVAEGIAIIRELAPDLNIVAMCSHCDKPVRDLTDEDLGFSDWCSCVDPKEAAGG